MQTMAAASWTCEGQNSVCPPQQRNLAGACLAHILHDGYTDQLYALLPVWQSEFGLSYAGLAVVRALYYGTMGGLQLPADKLTAALNPRVALALATFIAAAGYLVMALPFGFPGLCIGLILAGVGSSVQHPRASLLVTNTYGKASRGPLGIYNFAGDLGKATFPAIVALLLPIVAWRPVVGLMAAGWIGRCRYLADARAAAASRRFCSRRTGDERTKRSRFQSATRHRRVRYRDAHGLPSVFAVSSSRQGRQ